MYKIGVLGGGLSGISLAFFLQNSEKIDSIDIFEKEPEIGGLMKSYNIDGVFYDIGPHIIFSKNPDILELMKDLLKDNIEKLRRSQKVFYKQIFVKYPFENDLFSLPETDRLLCLNTFLNNPYETYNYENLLQFFLVTFGEGMTNEYFRSYNEKIWKFDPSFIDTQMVGRIPKPPKEDIIKSANGIPTEGFVHQLFFYYPKRGGIQSLITSLFSKLNQSKVTVHKNANISSIIQTDTRWQIGNSEKENNYNKIISTIPPQELVKVLKLNVPKSVKNAINDLKFNSIIIIALHCKSDNLGNILGINVPDKNIIFHRLTKLNFLGQAYSPENSSILLVEITFREGDSISFLNNKSIKDRIIHDLIKIKFLDKEEDVICYKINRFKYAYVIYDLNHADNIKTIKKYFEEELNITLCGRFGEFQYWNMDNVILRTMQCAKDISESIN